MSAQISNAFELIRTQVSVKRPKLQNLDNIVFDNAAHPIIKGLIEISGENCSGKSQLLQHIMQKCIMENKFGGAEAKVVFLDLKHKFDVQRFLEQMKNVIAQNQTQSEAAYANNEEHGLNYLSAVTFLSSYSSDDFILALDEVENILLEDQEIALLAIDGLDALYWLDVREKVKRMRTHYAQLSERLRGICMDNNICCIYTVNSNYLKAKTFNDTVNAKIYHRLECKFEPGLGRTLNGRAFTISDFGMEFL